MKKSNGWKIVTSYKSDDGNRIRVSKHAQKGIEIVIGQRGQGWSVVLLDTDDNLRAVGKGRTQDEAFADCGGA